MFYLIQTQKEETSLQFLLNIAGLYKLDGSCTPHKCWYITFVLPFSNLFKTWWNYLRVVFSCDNKKLIIFSFCVLICAWFFVILFFQSFVDDLRLYHPCVVENMSLYCCFNWLVFFCCCFFVKKQLLCQN